MTNVDVINWTSPEGVKILAEMTQMLIAGGECCVIRDENGKLMAVFAVGDKEDSSWLLETFYTRSCY